MHNANTPANVKSKPLQKTEKLKRSSRANRRRKLHFGAEVRHKFPLSNFEEVTRKVVLTLALATVCKFVGFTRNVATVSSGDRQEF